MASTKVDFLIIGAGIIGLALAYRLKLRSPKCTVLVIDKEEDVAKHASGRNSGVLHAGFYYTADSLKARFTVAGNKAMREFCQANNLPLNNCGKLVVAQNEAELAQLYELEKRGKQNGSTIEIIDASKAEQYEPNVVTYKKALYSPLTASCDPIRVCSTLKLKLAEMGVAFQFGSKYKSHAGNLVQTSQTEIDAARIVNCAGLYADKIAHDFGFGRDYTIIPFKGLYLKYAKNTTDLKMHIYPVPNLKNPFLGVHFTKTVDGQIKIGPTAIPAFWRENYAGFSNFKLDEFFQIIMNEAKLFALNSFNFRSLAFEEMQKYVKSHLIRLASSMVKRIDQNGFGEFTKPGIRAQLLHKKKRQLVQDFIVEGDAKSVHVLNAVSPGLTCSFPFADYLIDNYIKI